LQSIFNLSAGFVILFAQGYASVKKYVRERFESIRDVSGVTAGELMGMKGYLAFHFPLGPALNRDLTMKNIFAFSYFGARSGRRLARVFALGSLVLTGSLAMSSAEDPQLSIKVDQVGYPLHGPKLAFVDAPGTVFELRRSGDHGIVLKGKLEAAQSDANSGDSVQTADFSKFRKAGTYYIAVPGVGRSWDFAIGPNVFDRAYYLAMRGFYGQRCGTAVDLGSEFPGYAHAICHQNGEFHSSSGATGPRPNIGGWHDAGDYGRYIVNSSFATGTLLSAWEIFGKKIEHIALKIPETGNGTPDILNEIRWNLKWMLQMQDSDGGVWFKQTSEQFSGFVAPEDDLSPSKVMGTGAPVFKSTCASADLAAVGAIAARVYQPYDAAFAAQNLEAARKAWAWAEKNPNATFRNPPGVNTGEYGDGNCSDERLWAAAELFRTTGEAGFNDYVVANYAAFLPGLDSPPAESWNALAARGLWSYALSGQKSANTKVTDEISSRTVAAARVIVERTSANPYRISMKSSDFVWGSNGVAADYGGYLLMANLFEPDASFVNTARDNLHYLLGRNTFSLSWVTQLGQHPFQHPHHRPSGSGKQTGPWPGLLSGGPNAGRQDAVLAALPKDLPPAKVYADQLASYASNEICLNWQASLVFLLAGELQ
jgi:endoglucanase